MLTVMLTLSYLVCWCCHRCVTVSVPRQDEEEEEEEQQHHHRGAVGSDEDVDMDDAADGRYAEQGEVWVWVLCVCV